jgi:hypothetical protein
MAETRYPCKAMERRQHRRVPAQVQGLLQTNSHGIEGRTLDVSLGGARFESDLAVQPGASLGVKLIIPGAQDPIVIEQAQVQWVDRTLGVEFLEIRRESLGELER